MKRIIQELRLSSRLDRSDRSPQPAAKDSGPASAVDSLVALHERLRVSSTPAPEPPPWLHASIMNEVRCAADGAPAPSSLRGFRAGWKWAVATVVLIAAAGALMIPSQPGVGMGLNSSQADADGMVRTAASQSAVALIEPFEAELANLSRDLDRTTEFLLASLP